MEIEKAKELLRQKEQNKELEQEAIGTIRQEQLRQQQEKEDAEREQNRKEIYEFKAKIPQSLCRPYAKCRCGKEVELLNNKGLVTANKGLFRVTECECGAYVIDNLDLTGAENMGNLLPYVIHMER